MLTFGSLFAGIGGFDLGFERAGMQCKWQVELDDYSTKVLEKQWPQVHRERDIRTVGSHNLETVDVICGGFPCQDISYAGLGAGLDGERSGLFFEAIRVVRELQPRIVVLENVAALLTRGLDRVLGTLAEIGFDAEWHCIPACSVGAPHIRDRVFVIGYCANSKRTRKSRENEARLSIESAKMGERLQQKRNGESAQSKESIYISNANSKGLEKRQGKDARGTRQNCGTKPIRSEWWAAEPDVGRVANGIPRRVDRLKGLGNAVVPQVAEYIGRQIVEAVK